LGTITGTVHDLSRKKASQESGNPSELLVPEEGFEPSQARGPGDFECENDNEKPLDVIDFLKLQKRDVIPSYVDL
jgi:hypothetical protein